jgi:methionyl-tRNA formyltransferase
VPRGASTGASGARLRTVLCTCGGLYGALVLRRLRACQQLELCGVVRSSRVLDPRFGFWQGALGQMRRSGWRYTLYLWWTTTLTDWLCAMGGLGAVPMRSAKDAVPVLTSRDINDPKGLKFLAACQPDLLVCVVFNQRLRPATLALPKRACLNIHPSLLPEAKGVDPVFQALLHGTPLGVTVHYMNAEFDAGRIVAQRPAEPLEGASVFECTALLFREGAELLAGAIERVAAGEKGAEQGAAGSYQSWPSPAEVAELRGRGGALLRFVDVWRLLHGRMPR